MSYTQGDTAPALTGVCTSAGVGTDVTGADGVAHLCKPDGSTLSRSVAWTDETTGAWSLDWQPGDLTVAGIYQVEVKVTYSNGGFETFGPVSFYVQPQLA